MKERTNQGLAEKEEFMDPETLAKVRRARLILRIIMLTGILLPFILFFVIYLWPMI
tara:strand:- start:695 stop:862 length:168 start_codon:yes stop_codon:yes gene_type:complete